MNPHVFEQTGLEKCRGLQKVCSNLADRMICAVGTRFNRFIEAEPSLPGSVLTLDFKGIKEDYAKGGTIEKYPTTS